MQTPTLVTCNQTTIFATCYDLTALLRHDIMTVMGCLPIKGGRCDYDGGNFDSTGGGNRTENICRDGKTLAAQTRDAWVQSGRRVARQSIRTRRVEEPEQKSVCTAGSGKLNNSSSVARCDKGKLETLAQAAVEPYYLFAFCHMATRNASGMGGTTP